MLNSQQLTKMLKAIQVYLEAEKLEADDNYRGADLRQAEFDVIIRELVADYYGDFPRYDSASGSMWIPDCIQIHLNKLRKDMVIPNLKSYYHADYL